MSTTTQITRLSPLVAQNDLIRNCRMRRITLHILFVSRLDIEGEVSIIAPGRCFLMKPSVAVVTTRNPSDSTPVHICSMCRLLLVPRSLPVEGSIQILLAIRPLRISHAVLAF